MSTTISTPAQSTPSNNTTAVNQTPRNNDDIFGNKSFTESLLHDAFNPGVHPQSLDATNYALIALLICCTAALVAWNYSIHFGVIMLLGIVLLVSMKINRQPILDASAEYLRQQQLKKQEDEAKAAENGDDDLDEDEDYEYIYVEDDEDDEEGADEQKQDKQTTSTQQEQTTTPKNDNELSELTHRTPKS